MTINQICLWNVHQKDILFRNLNMLSKIIDEQERAAFKRLAELAESQLEVKQIRRKIRQTGFSL